MRALYRLLLHLCPRADRLDYGAEMEAAFEECLARERARRSTAGYLLACAVGIADLVSYAVRARWHLWSSGRRPGESRAPRRRNAVFVHDVRGALRVMRTQPIMSSAIVLMLALGIGATTAIFSVVYGVLLKPLPFADPDRIVQVWGSSPSRGWARSSFTAANFWDVRDRNRTFEDIGALTYGSFSLTGFSFPERVAAARVSAGFLRSLGVQPVSGRVFEPGEDQPGRGESIVVLSNAFWTRRFAGDPAIVGRTLMLDGQSYTVVGVLPGGGSWLDAGDVFVPFIQRPNANRGSFEYAVIGRLKSGVTTEAATADLATVMKDLESAYPQTNAGIGVAVSSSREWIANDQLRQTLWTLLGAVGLLLLIACLNVTNLLLVRASVRSRDNALRVALGASRLDVVRERLTETLLYSVAGSIVGWFLAAGLLQALKTLAPGGIPRLADVTLNGWVLAFAAGSAMLVGLITGIVPAMRVPLGNVIVSLRQGARGSAGDRGQNRLRNAFVTVEVALALLLLVGAGLLVRSLVTVMSVDRGFQAENRMLLTVSLPASYGEMRLESTVKELLSRMQSLPEVLSVAAVSGRPLSPGNTGLGLAAADKPQPDGAAVPWASWRIVTPDYFKTMGLQIIAGRGFTNEDLLEKPWRAVISKRTADLLWPGENPIGRTAILWKGQSNRRGEVIGVVTDMRERGLEQGPTLAVYFPSGGALATTTLQLVVHTRGRPQDVVPALRTTVAGVDASLPVSNIRTLEEVVTASLAARRMTMWMIAAFAGLALLLALAGVYGVLAYSVTRRTSEIGVRLALGAEHGRVVRTVLSQGMRPVVIGAALGLAAALAASRLMASLLFEVSPYDPATYIAVAVTVIGVATLACYLPARRVLRVDPATALRVE
jgi:putative ABC transport system permease protein